MKELMLCVILVAAGALARMVEPKEGFAVENVTFVPEEGFGGEMLAKAGEESRVAGGIRWNWCYTRWFNRDSPRGYGDYETFAHLRDENPRRICPYPYFMQVQTLAGVNAYATGQVFQFYDTVNGFVCENNQQSGYRRCLDYKVRFACPCSRTRPYMREAAAGDEAGDEAGDGAEAAAGDEAVQ